MVSESCRARLVEERRVRSTHLAKAHKAQQTLYVETVAADAAGARATVLAGILAGCEKRSPRKRARSPIPADSKRARSPIFFGGPPSPPGSLADPSITPMVPPPIRIDVIS